MARIALKSRFFSWLTIGLLLLLSATQLAAQDSDTTNQKDWDFAIYPAIGYQPETKLQLGAIAFIVISDEQDAQATYYRPTSISPYVLYTLNNQLITSIDYEGYLNNGWLVTANPRFLDYPDFYYGIGIDSKLENEERFDDTYFSLETKVLKEKSPNLFIGGRLDFRTDRLSAFDQDGDLIVDQPAGLNGGQLLGIGPSLLWDTRNNVLWPTSGHYLNAEISLFTDVMGLDYSYGSYLIDYRRYKSLWNEKNVIAFQAQLNGRSGSGVPFYALPKIGGDERLRGIANENLYRDSNAFFVQAEARKDLFWRFGGVLFAGAGTVFQEWGNPIEKMRVVYGLGGRMQALRDQKLNIRVDFGFSQDGQNALYVSIKEAF
jgi:hypothetical protein